MSTKDKKDKKQQKKEKREAKREIRKERRKKDDFYIEARKVLLNQVELNEEGHFVTTSQVRFPMWGAADGEGKVRFLGLSKKNYYYSTDLSNTRAIFRAKKAMTTIGRAINLHSDDNTAACIVRTYVFYPVVLIFYENDEADVQLTLYTPRTFSSFLAIRLAARKFDKAAEGILNRNGSDAGIIDRIREARYKKRIEKERLRELEEAEDSDDYDADPSDSLSVFDIDWSSDDDEITEDDLIPEDKLERDEEDAD